MACSEPSTQSPVSASSPAPSFSDGRRSTSRDDVAVDEEDVVQGGIFWLPQKEELPSRAVRRAHGKGAVEEGIYNHPVVVVSRPADDPSLVHFHLITSFQGKKLHEIYAKANDFHASRRSWYLPIRPAPDHPDATSKKSKKRFPTLELAGGALLRWDSYVNLRHVYKINWACLRPYANPDSSFEYQYRFERESMIRMLAKGRILTTYQPGSQLQRYSPPPTLQCIRTQTLDQEVQELLSPKSDSASTAFSDHFEPSPPFQSDFSTPQEANTADIEMPPKAPPDDTNHGGGQVSVFRYMFSFLLEWPWMALKRFWARLWRRRL